MLENGDGGCIFVAHQATKLLQAICDCVGPPDDELGSLDAGSGARRVPDGVATLGPLKVSATQNELATVALAKFLLTLGPKQVILCIMKLSTQCMDLVVLDPKNRDAFGGLDVLMPRKKREVLEKFNGNGLLRVQSLIKLAVLTTASDVQFGIAIGAVTFVALELLSQNVSPGVVAE